MAESSTSSSTSSGTMIPQNVADRLRRRKITKKGFRLCIMVCGRAGLGKSSFVNSLCDADLIPAANPATKLGEPTKEMQIRRHQIDLGEADGTVISLTVIDTPGFGEKIDSSADSATILRYIEAQFDDVLREEALVCRNPKFQDNRVHACLYFLPPTGHGLRDLDAEAMMTLSGCVNVIPVIGKADTMTDSELLQTKHAIMVDIEARKIPIFSFNYDLEEDEESLEENEALLGMLPFAIVGSNQIYQEGKEYIRGRQYPWGFVRIEDPEHSDFVALRSVLFGSHIHELRDTTQDIIYENYRTTKLFRDPDLLARIRAEETALNNPA